MAHAPNDRADPHQAIESFAKEMNLPVNDVVAMYEAAVAELAAKAKIDTYLHIFAMRDLQERLHVLGKRRL
jgi:adenosylcobinamide amidohydrolase